MGKRLILIRHAKSSWDHPGLRDFERPLNERGLRDAPPAWVNVCVSVRWYPS